MERLRDRMTLPSRVRYLAWRAIPARRNVRVKLVSGERLILRPPPALDLNIAREVFIDEPYCSPRPLARADVRRVVDVGANVGYSVVYWASRYPDACIEAFEPHPEHLRLIARHVELNGLTNRVKIRPVAVGTAWQRERLTDEGPCSCLNAQGGIAIEVVDFFEAIGKSKIDLLKMDIEGAEYDIIMDPRFAEIDVRAMVLEWHDTGVNPDAHRDIMARLGRLGRQVSLGPAQEHPEVAAKYSGFCRAGTAWVYTGEA